MSDWIDIQQEPPPSGKRCLVTNLAHAVDRSGEMSHIWILHPIESKEFATAGLYVGFDEADRKVLGITHWMPLPKPVSNELTTHR